MSKQVLRYVFPTATFKYLHLTKPDDNFNAANPDYNVTMVYPAAEGKKVIQDIENLMPQFKGKVPHKRDDDDNYIFKAKQRSRIEWRDRDTNEDKVMLFKPVIKFEGKDYEGAEPWGGSTGMVAVQLGVSKYNGRETLALRLKGVRLETIESGSSGQPSEEDELFFGASTEASPAKKEVVEANDFDDDIEFN